MLAILRTDGWLRRAAGVGCAYALALQMLLAGVVATQMEVAGPVGTAICFSGHSPDDQNGNSGGHAHNFHCVVCALVTLSAPPLAAAQAQPVPAVVAAPLPPVPAASVPVNPRHTPRSSQGPPRAA